MFIGPPISFPRLDIGDLFARNIHGDERVKIEVRVDADGVGLLLSERTVALWLCL